MKTANLCKNSKTSYMTRLAALTCALRSSRQSYQPQLTLELLSELLKLLYYINFVNRYYFVISYVEQTDTL